MSRYLTDLPTVLAGLNVGWQDGWQTRARNSGGYEQGGPWCVMWHHTAGAPGDSAWNAASYGSYSADARPVANAYVDSSGLIVVAAAGCTNTNGSGGPLPLPDGRVVPLDDMNRYAFGVEICNTGVGEPYTAAQIDACFALSNAIARAYIDGAWTNVASHQLYAPSRKIDPATATAVQGPWQPGSVTSSGSWDVADLRAECAARAGSFQPSEEEPMHYLELYRNSTQYSLFSVAGNIAVNITNAERDADRGTRNPDPPTVKSSDATCLKALVLMGDEPVWYDGTKWPPVSAFGGHLA